MRSFQLLKGREDIKGPPQPHAPIGWDDDISRGEKMEECPTGEEPDRGLENEVPCRVQARRMSCVGQGMHVTSKGKWSPVPATKSWHCFGTVEGT